MEFEDGVETYNDLIRRFRWLGLGSEEGWRGGVRVTSLKDEWPSSEQV